MAEVQGLVTLNGKALPQVRVQFMPDKRTVGPTSVGATDENGRFTLLCADERPGAVIGWHRVVITDMRVLLPRTPRQGRRDDFDKEARPKQPVEQPSRVPEKYTTIRQTPLMVEVKAGKQEFEVDLSQGVIRPPS